MYYKLLAEMVIQGPGVMEKVTTYEHFLNEVLKTDLKKTLEKREEVQSKIAEYTQQKSILEKLTSSPGLSTSIRAKVDLGCNFYVQSEIPNLDTIMMNIGCGTWLEVTPPEAILICEKQIAHHNIGVEFLTKQELKIKAHINLVIDALREIQSIELPNPNNPQK
jgi:prefoldin subunit 5